MKDIDKIQKRSRRLRDITEKAGSTGLAIAGLIGLLFLGVLVYQIAEPTFIRGEEGELTAATEWIPVTDYQLKWDFPNVDSETGELTTDPIIIRISWEDENGSQSHDLQIDVIEQRQVKTDVYITSDGVDQEQIEVGRKTKFYLYSTLDVIATVEQISGPVPSADESGYPSVNTFVIDGDLHILYDDNGEQIFQALELTGYLVLIALLVIMIWPTEQVLTVIDKVSSQKRIIRPVGYILGIATFYLSDSLFVPALLGSLCWIVSGIMLFRLVEGIQRIKNIGRELSETSRLKHSISSRDGLMMWSKMLLFTSTLFIPVLIDIPFLTERYQDIFIPYASGIRAAFYGTIWVMLIAMLVSIPISVGAAIYLSLIHI